MQGLAQPSPPLGRLGAGPHEEAQLAVRSPAQTQGLLEGGQRLAELAALQAGPALRVEPVRPLGGLLQPRLDVGDLVPDVLREDVRVDDDVPRRLQPVAEVAEENPVRAGAKARVASAAQFFPAPVEPRILTSGEAFALQPMTIEEAVSDAEFNDRDLLIFHNLSGELFVLHRCRDGQLELVEIP